MNPIEQKQDTGAPPALPVPASEKHPVADRFQESRPSLTPSFPLSYEETARVMVNVVSPEPHRGWHSRSYLPHWDHPGMIQSLNFRLGDAMPQELLDRWRLELGVVRRGGSGLCATDGSCPGSAGVSPASWPTHEDETHTSTEKQRQTELRRRIEEYLDAGHGACWLRRPDLAGLIEQALRCFDDKRYRLLAWCIMPNHVHALIETRVGFPLADILHSWKSFTAKEANRLLGRSGEFWQREYLDRYVRNAKHYEAVVAYIEENPVKAGLVRTRAEWLWSSARFRSDANVGISQSVESEGTAESKERSAGETPALPDHDAPGAWS